MPTHVPDPGRRLRRAGAASAVALVFASGVATERFLWQEPGGASAESSFTNSREFATLQRTWDLIHEDWALPDQVDDQALIYGAAAGMVDALGDEGHSRFLDPEEAADFEKSTEGEYTGIGVEIDFRRDRPVVVAPIDGSPADKAGIRSGDTIVAIEGARTDRMDPQQVADLLLGEAGAPVTISVVSQGASAPRELTLVRQKITVEPVSWRMLPARIAQVRVAEFSSGATQDLKRALVAVRAAGAEGVILDLRDDPGGLVSEAVGVASQFMDEGATIFQQQDRGAEPKPVRTVGRDGLWLDKPLVVLINDGSASAAEIVGGALADNHRALAVGERTFGTGTVLVPFKQPDGSIVLLGTAMWLSADGERLWKVGVEPEKVVEMPYDAAPSRPRDDADVTPAELAALPDPQLRAAWGALRAELTPGAQPAPLPAPPVLGPAA